MDPERQRFERAFYPPRRSEVPTREVSRARAREERLQAHSRGEGQWLVVNVKRGTKYHVSEGAGGWSCDCPWMTKKSSVSEGFCKHIVRVQDKVAKCSYGCEDNVGVQLYRGRFLCRRCRYADRFLT
jgi:hypothetical protein